MISPARQAAYKALRSVNIKKIDNSSQALARTRPSVSDERDRALVSEIVTGTLRWQAQLDYLIEHFARRPITRIDSEILDILRLSTYQLLHLDRVPNSAAVNEAVELTFLVGKRSAGGFVNAVLRAINNECQNPPLPPYPLLKQSSLRGTLTEDSIHEINQSEMLDYLSISLSHPRWLIQRWLKRYGFEVTVNWVHFNNRPAPLTLRVNRLRIDPPTLLDIRASHHITVHPTRYAQDGLIVTQGNPLRTPLAELGLFVVQTEASQLVAEFASVQPGECVLDACASPGLKTMALASMLKNHGLVVASDVRRKRIKLLQEMKNTYNATCVHIVQTDLLKNLPFHNYFDCVLVDAPCSGLGTIRRDPEIRWRRTEADLNLMADKQVTMLERAADVVRAGGRIIYSTYSSEPEENEKVVERFLHLRPDFSQVHRLSGNNRARNDVASEIIDEKGYLRTDPFKHGLEAFFGALLDRTSSPLTL